MDHKIKINITFLTIYITSIAPLFSATIVDLGAGEISGSTSGLSDNHTNVFGDPLGSGVTFDLTVSATNFSDSAEPVTAHEIGLGVSGGSNNELDNRNNTDPSDDESLTFTISNATNLPDNTALRITSLGVLFGTTAGQTEQYILSDGGSGTISSQPFDVTVTEQESITITASGPTSGSPSNTAFIIDRLVVELISLPVAPEQAKILAFTMAANNDTSISFNTEVGKDYNIQNKADLDESDWSDLDTVTGTGSVENYTFTTPGGSATPRQFYRVTITNTPGANGDLMDGATLTINQTWSQEPAGLDRTAAVKVPTGTGPFPVIIMLHGNGGDSNFINAMNGRLDSIIRVAPNGYLTSWNIGSESSKAPDVAFIRDLIALVKTYDNVDKDNISIFGSSNGSAMTNRLIIELDDTVFQKAACEVSQMLEDMYHDGSFWYGATSTDSYDTAITPSPGRKILAITGTLDPLIPYDGSIPGIFGKTFLHSQESIFRYAQAMGFTGSQLADSDGIAGNGTNWPADIVQYSYLGGDVVHYKVIGGNHGLSPYSDNAKDIVADFILNQ